jgi:oligoendopeptidase F
MFLDTPPAVTDPAPPRLPFRTGSDVTWDLSALLAGSDVTFILEQAEQLVVELERYRGTVATLDLAELATMMRLYERFGDLTGRASAYTTLSHYADTNDEEIAATMAFVDETAADLSSRLTFIDLEWAAADEEHTETAAEDPQLAFCRHHLLALREHGPHNLGEEAEKVDAVRAVGGIDAWRRLFGELEAELRCEMAPSSGMVAPGGLEETLALLASPDRAVRVAARDAVSAALEHGLRTRTFIYNQVVLERETTDELRGFDTWVSAWNLENDTTDEQVDMMIEVIRARYDIARDWYRLKGEILGRRLDDADRYTSLSLDNDTITFDDAVEVVLDAFAAFSPLWAQIAELFVKERWIDAAPRPGKHQGAFCDYTVASANPYILLNWTGRLADVVTLAHELGHGVHGYLSRTQGWFHQETPLTMAETASVFAEMLVMGRLVERCGDPSERLALLAGQMDDMVNTVFRQVALFTFEERAHTTRREHGELSTGEIGEIWLETQREMFDDTLELSDAYASWWSYIPHFFDSPGYVYAYPFGQVVALAAYRRYLEDGPAFADTLNQALSAGATLSPQEFGELLGMDVTDARFWSSGLDVIAGQIEQARLAAQQCGRLAAAFPAAG